ncbi:hypothetical protein QQM39_41395 [Streptomyces sp. DT2A-34]|uniref:hypothetical protein n=1 Tax=Streptomyces sp. DT2A-34 TaxID=3051182 RepID=UPI00265C5F48|nr:hypothetical protein [Streptomyces sp. DT2A-34]MDO0917029.1 hypothetical protein [Streptomyces sp. DT2A-34]
MDGTLVWWPRPSGEECYPTALDQSPGGSGPELSRAQHGRASCQPIGAPVVQRLPGVPPVRSDQYGYGHTLPCLLTQAPPVRERFERGEDGGLGLAGARIAEGNGPSGDEERSEPLTLASSHRSS